jgi:hypothetical protein
MQTYEVKVIGDAYFETSVCVRADSEEEAAALVVSDGIAIPERRDFKRVMSWQVQTAKEITGQPTPPDATLLDESQEAYLAYMEGQVESLERRVRALETASWR